LVNQELGSSGVSVLDALCEPDSIGKDSITSLNWEVLCRSNLNDLLVTTLDTAVTLVEMDDVALVVTKKLDFNVLGLVEEALDEDGSVTESRLGFRGGALERVLEGLLFAYYTHTTATTAESGLDDDGKAILVSEGLDILELLNWSRSSWYNWDVALDGEFSRRDLVAKCVDGVGRGAYELKAKVSMSRVVHG
jgi:hypothetical protein